MCKKEANYLLRWRFCRYLYVHMRDVLHLGDVEGSVTFPLGRGGIAALVFWSCQAARACLIRALASTVKLHPLLVRLHWGDVWEAGEGEGGGRMSFPLGRRRIKDESHASNCIDRFKIRYSLVG